MCSTDQTKMPENYPPTPLLQPNVNTNFLLIANLGLEEE